MQSDTLKDKHMDIHLWWGLPSDSNIVIFIQKSCSDLFTGWFSAPYRLTLEP